MWCSGFARFARSRATGALWQRPGCAMLSILHWMSDVYMKKIGSPLWLIFALMTLAVTLGCEPDEDATPSPDAGTDNVNALVYACVKSAACDVRAYPRVSDCVNDYKTRVLKKGLGPVYARIYRCTRDATSCDQVKACFGEVGSCSASDKAMCYKGKAMYCDLIDNTTYTMDCQAAGMTCKVDASDPFTSTCTGGASEAPLPETVSCQDGNCTNTGQACSSAPLNRCSGQKLQACLQGKWVLFNCEKMGMQSCDLRTVGSSTWGRCKPFTYN